MADQSEQPAESSAWQYPGLNRTGGPLPLQRFWAQIIDEPRVRQAIAEEIPEAAATVLAALRAGEELGAGRDPVHDLLSDLASNESDEVQTLYGLGTAAGAFPISIMRFGPAFWVSVPEFDSVGFFTTSDDAVRFAECEWEPYITAMGEASQD